MLFKVVINQARVIQRICLRLLIETLERRQQITSECVLSFLLFLNNFHLIIRCQLRRN